MISSLIVLQIFIVIGLILLVFMEKNSSESVANLTGGGNSNTIATSAGILQKLTAFVAIMFLLNSIFLAKLTNDEYMNNKKLVGEITNDDMIDDAIVNDNILDEVVDNKALNTVK